jgi:hypothetical protein
MSVLENHMRALSAEARGGVSNAIFGIVGGALSITLGTYIEEPASATYLYLSGGAAATNAIVSLVFRPNPVDDSITIAQMPMRTPDQLQLRVEAAEQALASIASKHRVLRLVDATTSIALGAAVIPLFTRSDSFRLDDSLGFIVVAGALASIVTGGIRLFSLTTAERRWNTYQSLAEGHQTRRAGNAMRLRGSLFAAPGSAGVALHATF